MSAQAYRKQILSYRDRENAEDGEWQVGQRAQKMTIIKWACVAVPALINIFFIKG